MRVIAVETIRSEAYPNINFVEVHTEAGLAGLGETFPVYSRPSGPSWALDCAVGIRASG